ncbi:adenylyltransferase and sulfurtransferase MOCS3 [Pholidichthys leucotaenia]
MSKEVLRLRIQLEEKEKEISALRDKLAQVEKNEGLLLQLQDKVSPPLTPLSVKSSLSSEDIRRYSRQLLLPQLGVQGQLKLFQTSVLVVGCGGLGCPAAQYLAAAGIGRLGLVDYDEVELSNLHRQILHGERNQGQTKALSAAQAVTRLNSSVECVPYHLQLSPENALQLIQHILSLTAMTLIYDIVADCSDNVSTRYLVNDACVLAGKPLVSAAALRMEGQLSVFNYGGGPCYRCLYPSPPPPETVTNCADGGVLGVVPGIMGCFQALEVLKIVSGLGSSCSQQLLLFDAELFRFRSIRLRSRQPDCAVCGESPTVTRLVDYEAFCGSAATDKCHKLNLLSSDQRITVQDYKSFLDQGKPHLLLDVRPQVEVEICSLPFSLNIPLCRLKQKKREYVRLLEEKIAHVKQQMEGDQQPTVVVICKQGNDSQKAVQLLEMMSGSEVDRITVKDVCGGLMAWSHIIDPTFPQY